MDSLVWVDQKVAEADGGGAAMKNPFFDTSLPCPSRRSWLWLSTLGLISTCTYLSVANSEIYSPCVSAAQMLCSANHLHCVIFLIGRWQSATNLLNCSLSFDRRHCDLQWRRIVGRWWWMKTSSDDIIILFSLQVHNRSEMQFITFVLGSYGVHNLRWTLYEGGRRSLIRHNTHAMPINGPSWFSYYDWNYKCSVYAISYSCGWLLYLWGFRTVLQVIVLLTFLRNYWGRTSDWPAQQH